MTQSLPLVVDLDGALTLADTLDEGVVGAVCRRPLSALTAVFVLAQGRAAFKRRIAQAAEYDFDTLPLRAELVAWLREQSRNGRGVHLVTGADQGIADEIARRLEFIDTARGSRGTVNLVGRNKQEYLRAAFPGGYVYAGNDSDDLDVWRDADGIVLAGAPRRVEREARALGKPVEASFPNAPAGIRLWCVAFRLHQCVKNLLVFAPLLLSGEYRDPAAIAAAFAAFAALTLVASGSYIFNDLADLAADRAHPGKRLRPFASGRLGIRAGLAAALAAIGAGLALAASVAGALAAVFGVYLCVTAAYSGGLKRLPLVDTSILAVLFTIRIAMGGIAVGVDISNWLMVFSMFFFLSLSLAKRHVEILAQGDAPFRGYRAADAPLTLGVGLSGGMAAIVVLCLYLVEEAFPSDLYAAPGILWAVPFTVAAWLLRVWLRAQRGELDDDPVSFAVRDRVSLCLGAAMLVAFAAATVPPFAP